MSRAAKEAREDAFVAAVKRGLRGATAAREAGFKDGPGLAVTASRMMRRPRVRLGLGLPAEEVRKRRHSGKRRPKKRGAKKAPTASPSKPTVDAAPVVEGPPADPVLAGEAALRAIRDDQSQPASARIRAINELERRRQEREARAAQEAAAVEEAADELGAVILLCNGRGPGCGDTIECALAHLRRLTPDERAAVLRRLGVSGEAA